MPGPSIPSTPVSSSPSSPERSPSGSRNNTAQELLTAFSHLVNSEITDGDRNLKEAITRIIKYSTLWTLLEKKQQDQQLEVAISFLQQDSSLEQQIASFNTTTLEKRFYPTKSSFNLFTKKPKFAVAATFLEALKAKIQHLKPFHDLTTAVPVSNTMTSSDKGSTLSDPAAKAAEQLPNSEIQPVFPEAAASNTEISGAVTPPVVPPLEETNVKDHSFPSEAGSGVEETILTPEDTQRRDELIAAVSALERDFSTKAAELSSRRRSLFPTDPSLGSANTAPVVPEALPSIHVPTSDSARREEEEKTTASETLAVSTPQGTLEQAPTAPREAAEATQQHTPPVLQEASPASQPPLNPPAPPIPPQSAKPTAPITGVPTPVAVTPAIPAHSVAVETSHPTTKPEQSSASRFWNWLKTTWLGRLFTWIGRHLHSFPTFGKKENAGGAGRAADEFKKAPPVIVVASDPDTAPATQPGVQANAAAPLSV